MIKTINLQDLLKEANQETLAMMEQGIDISDPSIITPLEVLADRYPDIAFECNQVLIALVKEQMNLISQQPPYEIVNEFLTDME